MIELFIVRLSCFVCAVAKKCRQFLSDMIRLENMCGPSHLFRKHSQELAFQHTLHSTLNYTHLVSLQSVHQIETL